MMVPGALETASPELEGRCGPRMCPYRPGAGNRLVRRRASPLVATVKGPNRGGAKQFVDFLLTLERQRLLVMETFEMPLVPGAQLPTVQGLPIKDLSDFREMKVGYEALAELTEEPRSCSRPRGRSPGRRGGEGRRRRSPGRRGGEGDK